MNQENERLGGTLQENVLTLLCFGDEKIAKMVRATVTPHLFESSIYKEIAGHAVDFIDQYGESIKEHLPDHLEGILHGDDQRKASSYKRALDNLFMSRDSVNADYVVKQLHKFVRIQKFKSGLVAAVEALERQDGGNIDEAETIMVKAMAAQAVAFDAGLSLRKPSDIAKLIDKTEEEGFTLGIPALDDEGIYPRRKEMFLLMAARGKGKTWFLTHAAKRALMQRWKVLIVTLEVSDNVYMGRFLQSFFSIAKRKAEVLTTRLETSRDGSELSDILRERIERPTMQDDDIKDVVVDRAKKEFKKRPPIYIKQFPTNQLTLKEFEAYLDGLERFEGFVPDAILFDYPDLLDIDPKNLRVETGRAYGGLRGIAVARNMALVAVTQGNRDSEDAKLVTGSMAAEDISKLAHADNFLTYSQTAAEYDLGVARLYVEKARNEAAKFQVLITQAISIGQFCLDSFRLKGSSYWELMKGKAGGRRKDDAPEEGAERPRRRSEPEDEPRPRRATRRAPDA